MEGVIKFWVSVFRIERVKRMTAAFMNAAIYKECIGNFGINFALTGKRKNATLVFGAF